MFKESKGIRDIHSLYESIYGTEFNIENQLVSLQETVGFNDLTEDDLIELTDLIESVEFASLTEEEKRNILQKVQDKLATSKKAGFLGQLERTRRKIFGTKQEKEKTKKFDNEHELVSGVGIKKKENGDDDKDKIEGPNINIKKSNNKSNNKTDDKTDKKQDTGSFFKGSGQNPENFKNPQAQTEYLKLLKDKNVNPAEIDTSKYFKDTSNNKTNSDDEKGANEWGPGGQPSASKQIDAYKKGRPSPASFKTNQRQTRELIKKQSKEVYPTVTKQDLNQFNRTKKYTADDGSQVQRSTVFTKHYKTGKPLGVMTGSQRKAYDKAAAAHKAGTTTTPKPVETKIDTSFKSNKEKDTFKRRDQKLLDKGLKPPKYEKDSPTYTTKIGAFLNNKKKGDLKGTTKHTITKIDHNNEGYDAKGDDNIVEDRYKTDLHRKQDYHKKPYDKKGRATGKVRRNEQDIGRLIRSIQTDSYDAYDLVLNYIMESKQASSIEEANYIMLEMDQNTIHEIVVEQKKNSK